MNTLLKLALAAALTLAAAGCKYLDGSDSNENLLLETKDQDHTASTFGSGPEKIWLDKAKENFRHGEFGLAERYYRQAIEERHNNVEAWLGLAASYDRLKRFDEADRAYKVVTAMVGNTPAVLNNLGYHYMLKGEFAKAESTLRSALEKDPNNPYIKSNLAQLSAWKAKAGYTG